MMGLAASLTQPSRSRRIWRSTTMFGVSFQERHRQRLISCGVGVLNQFCGMSCLWMVSFLRPTQAKTSADFWSLQDGKHRHIFFRKFSFWGSIPLHFAAQHWWAKDLRWDVDSFKTSSNREGLCRKKNEVTTPTKNAKRCSDIPTLGVDQGVIQATSDW